MPSSSNLAIHTCTVRRVTPAVSAVCGGAARQHGAHRRDSGVSLEILFDTRGISEDFRLVHAMVPWRRSVNIRKTRNQAKSSMSISMGLISWLPGKVVHDHADGLCGLLQQVNPGKLVWGVDAPKDVGAPKGDAWGPQHLDEGVHRPGSRV